MPLLLKPQIPIAFALGALAWILAAQTAFEPKVQTLGFATKVPRWREVVELT